MHGSGYEDRGSWNGVVCFIFISLYRYLHLHLHLHYIYVHVHVYIYIYMYMYVYVCVSANRVYSSWNMRHNAFTFFICCTLPHLCH